MLSYKEKKAIERIEDFLTTNIIISISNDDTANSEELKAFISKNEYLAIEFIATMFLKHSQEIEELKKPKYILNCKTNEITKLTNDFVSKDKIKAKIEELNKDFKEYENGQEWEIQDEIRGQIEVLQSLLEKE